MQKVFFVVALCLCALPLMMARELSEEELLATRMLLDVPTAGMSVEEQMVIASGMYGAGSVGGYGGLVTDEITSDISSSSPLDTGLFESAQQSSSTPAAAPTTTKSSASSAQFSLVAGVVAAAAVFLL